MKARIMQEAALIYSQPSLDSSSLRSLHNGDVVEIGRVKKAGDSKWVEVILPGNARGYLPGDTHTFFLQRVATQQKETKLYATAARDLVKTTLKKGTVLEYQNVVSTNGENWIEVQGENGIQGYIEPQTMIIPSPRVTKKAGMMNMVVGAVFFLLGSIVTIATYSSVVASGGSYYIWWGAILFGAVQFIQGLVQYLKAKE